MTRQDEDWKGWRAFARVWFGIGALGFGGPAGQIALMHRELVERRGWIADSEFARAVGLCTLLPGPEAHQLSVWCGWRQRGVAGGLVAGLGFILPGIAVMAALIALYLAFGELAAVRGLFWGIRAVVLAVVAQALARIAGRILHGPRAWGIAALAFALLFFLDVPFPAVMLAAGAFGWLGARGEAAGTDTLPPPDWRHSLVTIGVWAAVWLTPLAATALWLGGNHPLVILGRFFAGQAVVSFGGAYAALAYVAQAAADGQHWLNAAEMLDGLGLAETTPGPLVLVFQFVGGLAGSRIDGPWSSGLGATLGMALVVWMTLAPSFLWIFVAAPHLERLTRRPGPAGALAAITAAVAGVMANLAAWFALHVLFTRVGTLHLGPLRLWVPDGRFDLAAAVLAATALVLLIRLRLPLGLVLALGAAAGLAMNAA